MTKKRKASSLIRFIEMKNDTQKSPRSRMIMMIHMFSLIKVAWTRWRERAWACPFSFSKHEQLALERHLLEHHRRHLELELQRGWSSFHPLWNELLLVGHGFVDWTDCVKTSKTSILGTSPRKSSTLTYPSWLRTRTTWAWMAQETQ